jgi:Ca-activated chloride channel homolog
MALLALDPAAAGSLISVHVEHWQALLALVLLAPMLGAPLLRGRRPRDLRERAAWVLTALAVLAAVFGLADPRIDSGPRSPAVLAVDGSASIDRQEAGQERSVVARFAASDCETPCRIIRFAGGASASAATSGQAADRAATDIQDGVAAAVGLEPRGGRVVVLSDGAQTNGDLMADAPLARARQVRVSWVRLRAGAARDAAITSLELPAAVHLGDSVPISLTVHSTTTGFALLTVRSDGSSTRSQTIRVLAGDNPLLLLYTAARRGWHAFQASVSLQGDGDPHDNSLSAVTDVLAAPRVLVVAQPGSTVPGLLAKLGMRVRVVAAGQLPASTAGYLDEDAVVLDDVPATALSRVRAVALDDAVTGDGLGLLALGGPRSFSLGRYATSPLQSILPVRSLVPGNLQRRNVAIELVLDHSGSMIDRAGGVPKITMTHKAATQTAGFIAAHDDQLGIIDFDIVPHTLIPIERLGSAAVRDRVDRKVDGLQANGGTNIYLGLRAGYEQLMRSHAQERHIILMTDGITPPANYTSLFAELRAAHISVATVALGSDADRTLLTQISTATGGHAYATDNAHDLPKIFAKETQLSAKPVRVRGHLAVSLSSDSAVVRSLLRGGLPAVSGNVVTTVQIGAQADLIATGAKSTTDPALAEWQIGAGRVVAFTPGLGSPWGAAWLARPSLWNDAIRWLERGVQVPALTPVADPDSSSELEIDLATAGAAALGVTGVSGTLTDAAGASSSVQFSAAGPALYTANVAGLPPGVYSFSLATSGAASLRSSGEVAIPYPDEFSPVPAEVSPLAELVHQTGGRVTAVSDLGPVLGGEHNLAQLLTLVALVFFLAGVALRLLPGRRLRPQAEFTVRRRRGAASRSGPGRAPDRAARR